VAALIVVLAYYSIVMMPLLIFFIWACLSLTSCGWRMLPQLGKNIPKAGAPFWAGDKRVDEKLLKSFDEEEVVVVPKSTPDLPANRVVDNILRALQENDYPDANSGLRTFWAWTHELYRGRPVNGHGNFDTFAGRAGNSELGQLIGSSRWTLEPLNLVADGDRYATQVARVYAAGDSDGTYARRYLFQLRREQRPPYNGAWSVWGVIVSDVGGQINDVTGGF